MDVVRARREPAVVAIILWRWRLASNLVVVVIGGSNQPVPAATTTSTSGGQREPDAEPVPSRRDRV
jgi:hypothetical protein